MALIGIDLGTTNSLVAYWRDAEATLIPNQFGSVMTPSVVSVDDRNEILVGAPARERLLTHPAQTVANFKRYMGTSRRLDLGRQVLRPEEIAALVLKSLKADAEAALGVDVTDAVISVPAYFNDVQRRATRVAGQLAGLKVDRLINEPTGAAMAYGLHDSVDEHTFLVFDIGGGTFDVSILEMFSGVMQVHAAAGDNFLGGEDFVDRLIDMFVERTGLRLKQLSRKESAALRRNAEACKKELTDSNTAIMRLPAGKGVYEAELRRDEFERACEPLLDRLRIPVDRALRDAQLRAVDMDSIVLVGGATRMPMIRSLAAKMLGQIPHMSLDPDEVVARGAGVLTGLLTGHRDLQEIVLTDVCPYTLGTEVLNENNPSEESSLFHPIIERNRPVPISRSDTLFTASDFQTLIRVGIYQGEGRLAKDNIKLGSLDLSVPPKPRGEEAIEVRFTYDINGLLEVEVKVLSTGETRRVVVEGNPGMMTAQEIKAALARLADLKIHPRDKLENTLIVARGERLYEELLGDSRTYVAELLRHYEAILNRQDPNEIADAREQITQAFDDLESTVR